jgi:hypothetical protein
MLVITLIGGSLDFLGLGEELELGFCHVSVLWAIYLLSGLFSTASPFLIDGFNIGLRLGFEGVPT